MLTPRAPHLTLGLTAVFVLLVTGPREGLAQMCPPLDPENDAVAPTVAITPGFNAKVFNPSVLVTVSWADSISLDGANRVINVNGVDRTSEFSYEGVSSEDCWTRAKSEATITLNAGWNTLYGKICDLAGNCGERTERVFYEDKPAPLLSTAPHNGDILSPALCAACFDLIYAHTTPAYVSLGTPRGVTLFYSSYQAAPRGLITLDAWNRPENPNPPDKMSISLKRPDGTFVTFTTGTTEIFYTYGLNGTVRLTAQFDASGLASGAYRYTAAVRSWWGSTVKETTTPVRVLVQNEGSSGVFPGWTIAGAERLVVQGDTLLVLLDGAGTIIAFPRVATDIFRAPRSDFSEIRKTASGTYTRLWRDSTKAFYSLKVDGAVRLDSIKDRFGARTWLRYASLDGKLERIDDPLGKVTLLQYTCESCSPRWLRYILDPRARETELTRDGASNDLIAIRDPDLLSQGFTYDAGHRMLTSTDREGATTDYAYDLWGKLSTNTLAQVTLHDGSQTRPQLKLFAPELRALPASGTGSSSIPAARVAPDSVYAVTVGPVADTTRTWFNFLGLALKTRDPSGRVMQVTYDGHGQETLITLPSGQKVIRSWTADRVAKDSIAGYRGLNYAYHPLHGLLERVTQKGVVLTTYYYSNNGALDSTRVANDTLVSRHYHDSLGRDTAIVDRQGHRTRYIYDSASGNLSQVIRHGGQTTTLRFDRYGRDSLTINPMNDTTRILYDALNRVTSVYDPVNPNPTRTHYGPIYADSLTDPKGERYRFVHDALGWVTERYGPASATNPDRYGYDAAGRVREWTNRNGQVITYALDVIGRTTQVAGPAVTLDFGYDPTGQDRFTWGRNAWGTDTVWLSPAALVDSTKTVRGSAVYRVGYSYGHWSMRPTAVHDRYNNRTITLKYNDAALLDTLIVRGKVTSLAQRNPDGLAESRLYPPVWFGQFLSYTTEHRIDDLRWRKGNDTLVYRNFAYDSSGRITRITRDSLVGGCRPEDTFSYDRLGQVRNRSVWCGSAITRADTFTYDPVGNRTDHGAVIDTGSRLRRIAVHGDTVLFDYDDAGNVIRREELVSGKVQDLYWSALGHLDSVVTTSGSGTVVSRYRYDALGRRIRQQVGTSTIEYVWAGDHVLFDVKDSVTSEYSYLPGTDRLHAVYRDGQFHYFLTDHLGSVAKVADSTVVVKNQYTYDPWGWTESQSELVENRFRFAGREFDAETGFYHMRARYYDGACGRFISEDPTGLGGGPNPYAYANNNPIGARDPTGLDTELEWEETWCVYERTRVCIGDDCGEWSAWTPVDCVTVTRTLTIRDPLIGGGGASGGMSPSVSGGAAGTASTGPFVAAVVLNPNSVLKGCRQRYAEIDDARIRAKVIGPDGAYHVFGHAHFKLNRGKVFRGVPFFGDFAPYGAEISGRLNNGMFFKGIGHGLVDCDDGSGLFGIGGPSGVPGA